jgi:hypothetical protein
MPKKNANIKPIESFCIGCGRMYPIDDFYKSPNPRHANGVQPYCRECSNKITQDYLKKYKNMEAAIFYTCADMGVPFVRKLYNLYMNNIKSYKVKSYWGNYTKYFQANKTKAEEEAWTGFDGTDVDYKDIASIQKSEKAIEEEQVELRYRWGADKNTTQLQYLESRWSSYVKNKELDVAQEQLYRNLCLAELDIWENNDVDKAMKRQRDMMKDLGLDKFEVERQKTDVEKMIEYDIWLMENEEPAEYYKDKGMYKDFRGIHAGWIKEIKRPLLNLITGSKDYNIEKEDAEDWVENNKEELNDE